MWFLVLCLWGGSPKLDIQALEQIFLEGDTAAFADFLPDKGRISTDLRPILPDHGYISVDQTILAFEALTRRYQINIANIQSSQSDTNFAWLEIGLWAELEDKRSGFIYQTLVALQFKIREGRIALNSWRIQDVK